MVDPNPFGVLPREADPPPLLRERVLNDLRRRGLVRPGRSRLGRVVVGLAASAALFFAGLMVGSRAPAPLSSAGNPYVLLLYPSDRLDPPIPHEAAAAEYRAWARGLGPRFIAGDALGEQRLLGGGVSVATPTGYFVVRAASWDDAMAIAGDCPHLRHGGVVAVLAVLD
jgi:hypothetical protein